MIILDFILTWWYVIGIVGISLSAFIAEPDGFFEWETLVGVLILAIIGPISIFCVMLTIYLRIQSYIEIRKIRKENKERELYG